MKKGWQTKTLGEICDIERGGSPRPIKRFITTDPSGINWIKIGDATASGKYIYKTEEKIKPDGVKRSRMVYDGDFILSNSMSFGRPYIMKTTGCIHDGWLVLHQPKVDPDYLYHALSSDLVFDQFDRLAAGSTVRNLNIGLAKSVEIPYPPLAEQQRIVGLLDEAFEGLATAKANAEKNLQNARALFESHLQSVFTHRGPGWVEKKVESLGEIRTGKRDANHKVENGPYPFYTCAFGQFKSPTFSFDGPSIILPGNGANVGKVFFHDDKFEAYQRTYVVNELSQGINPRFLYFCFSAKWPGWIATKQFGSATNYIVVGDLKAFPVPTPSLLVQEAIVEKLESFTEQTQRLARLYERKLAALEALKKSLLHQAFTGQL